MSPIAKCVCPILKPRSWWWWKGCKTGDLPLAYRCIKKGAKALGSTGTIFSEDNIGSLLATRDLMAELRGAEMLTGGGSPPFQRQDRSRFLQSLDQLIQNVKLNR